MVTEVVPKERITSSGTLRRRAFGAGLWSVLEMGLGQSLRLASNLIMVRILLPDAFGAMAIVTMLLTAFTLFSDIGIHRSIVRSPRGEEAHYLRAAWSIQIVRSLGIALCVVIMGAGLWVFGPRLAAAGTIYADRELPFLVMVASLAMVFQGLISTNQWLAARRLEYRQLASIRLISQFLGMALMVPLAMLTHSVWALLSALLATSFALMFLSHVALRGPRMGWVWDREIADELWQFGKWLIGSSIFTFVQNSADRFILGGLLKAQAFGFYIIAVLWVNVVVTLTQKLIERVGFSTISEVLNNRPHDLEKVLRKLRRVLDAICVSGFLGLIFVAPYVVRLLYPPQYETSAHYLFFLAPLVLTLRFRILASVAMVHGNTRLMMIASALNATLSLAFLLLGYKFVGIKGALLAVAYAQLPSSVIFIVWTGRHLNFPIKADLAWLAGIIALGGVLLTFGPL